MDSARVGGRSARRAASIASTGLVRPPPPGGLSSSRPRSPCASRSRHGRAGRRIGGGWMLWMLKPKTKGRGIAPNGRFSGILQ